jgi:hypothetical protein
MSLDKLGCGITPAGQGPLCRSTNPHPTRFPSLSTPTHFSSFPNVSIWLCPILQELYLTSSAFPVLPALAIVPPEPIHLFRFLDPESVSPAVIRDVSSPRLVPWISTLTEIFPRRHSDHAHLRRSHPPLLPRPSNIHHKSRRAIDTVQRLIAAGASLVASGIRDTRVVDGGSDNADEAAGMRTAGHVDAVYLTVNRGILVLIPEAPSVCSTATSAVAVGPSLSLSVAV